MLAAFGLACLLFQCEPLLRDREITLRIGQRFLFQEFTKIPSRADPGVEQDRFRNETASVTFRSDAIESTNVVSGSITLIRLLIPKRSPQLGYSRWA